MDAVLAPLFHETVEHYRDLAAFGFALPGRARRAARGGHGRGVLDAELAALGDGFPELAAERLAPGEPHALEPWSHPSSAGLRMDDGLRRPARGGDAGVRPARRGRRRADRARQRGHPADVRADVVVVAAGPWTCALADPSGAWRPIAPLWGVNVEVHLPEPPRHAVEEAGLDELLAEGGGEDGLFALVTAGRVSSLGATFLPDEPDAAARAPRLRERGARFVPALADAPIVSVRACARPRSADGRPLLGRRGELVVAAGHGPGASRSGPASARLVADLVLGREPAIPRRSTRRASKARAGAAAPPAAGVPLVSSAGAAVASPAVVVARRAGAARRPRRLAATQIARRHRPWIRLEDE